MNAEPAGPRVFIGVRRSGPRSPHPTKMTSRAGFISLLLSTFLGISLAQRSAFDINDLAPLKCRIAGVVVAEAKDHKYRFNYTTAEIVCQQLGLQLASKAEVEKAHSYGFETCSYGWVKDQTGVISRIQHNEKCGKNKTGVVTWSADLSTSFHAYCFNASDKWINSCKPEFPTTAVPTTEPQSATASRGSSNETARTESQTNPTTLPPLRSTTRKSDAVTAFTKLLEIVTTRLTPAPPTPESQGLGKNGNNAFGGLPAALLTLALLFFFLSVVLGVCYFKKYKTHLLFDKKKEEEKEAVETKVFKENGNSENPKADGQTPNGKGAEEVQAATTTTRTCMEAEV
ncbi:lymphatic vessel endothelial hyaluronic acid receptor 1 [Spea bombifrons]|uniref:lymphatic vessel endothelial hyaluronic acid receptor 1 n=1 Tax=Spea bombifrons TaxID=233779 RepID=UPI002349C78A|nr:lymphatic vessel endothelial hyaluronic acid receptor 1 [Spea bombifrons]